MGEKLGVANIIIYARKIDSDYNVNGFNIVKFIPGKGKDEAGTRKQYEKIFGEEEPRFFKASFGSVSAPHETAVEEDGFGHFDMIKTPKHMAEICDIQQPPKMKVV